jgi:hypothetical protein
VFVAVALAALATAAVIVITSSPEPPTTDVVGSQIFSDFNAENYLRAYYAVIGLFPIAALLTFLWLTRIGARIGLPVPPSRGRLRPGYAPALDASPLDAQPPVETIPRALQWATSAGRTAFVGAVLGLEVGIVSEHVWAGIVAGAAVYALTAVLVAAASSRWRGDPGGMEAQLATLNSIAAPLTLVGLVAVSSHTAVTVLSNGTVHHYPWFPLWLGLPVAAALATVIAVSVRRAGSATRLLGIERRALLLLVTPVGLFLLLSSLPGDLGPIEMFESGQPLMGARLVGDGWFPWRDVILVHGLFQDAAVPLIGYAMFENNYWGWEAARSVLINPLFYLSLYFLFVYLFGRSWPFLVLTGLLILGTTWVSPINTRFILWPLILLILAVVLSRPAPLKCIGLALTIEAQALVTPEAAPLLPGVALIVFLYEWYWRKPGSDLAAAFRRTIWFTASAIALASAVAGYLAAAGALDDYVYITASLVSGHAASGGIPPTPVGETDPRFAIEAFAPPAAFLICFAYVAVRLRLRRSFLTEDWVMGAAAIFAIPYYLKFLSYMDSPHLSEVFGIALPLVLFIVFRLVDSAELWIRSRWRGNPILRTSTHPIGLAMVLVIAVLGATRVKDHVANAETNYRPNVPAPPSSRPVGYSSAPFDSVMYRDLKRVVDAYLDPNDRLFDFTNAPTYYYYLMDRDPSTRYPIVLVAHSERLQDDLVEQLRRGPPKLIIFDATAGPGLSNWDGIPNMVRHYDVSAWILDHYRPLLATHSTTIYARRDMPSPSQVGLHLTERPVTRGVQFRSQPCTWGFVPNFLDRARDPDTDSKPASARLIGPPRPQITISGWAADAHAEAPARQVVVTIDGKVAARVTPKIDRGDLVAAGLPPGYERSGFRIVVPVTVRRAHFDVRVIAFARDGSATELAGQGTPAKGSVRLGTRLVKIDTSAVQGAVDQSTASTVQQIELPRPSHWRRYRWLEVDGGRGGFQKGTFTLYDRRSRPSTGREISFQTLDDSPTHYTIPVASCPQWHGYRGRRLYLAYRPPQKISGVKVIR